ncbi:MAG: hypothetical protein DMF85_16045, partial [Acidobacteria bacterium]
MGLWGPVYLTESGPIALRHVYVKPALDVPSLKSADLTVIADVWNATDAAVTGTLRARFDTFGFTTPVTLGPKERKTIRVTPAQASSLRVNNPRVWWPYRMGTPELYRATVEVETGGAVSDRQHVEFGIRQVTSELTDKGHRLYRVNGRPILIRDGAEHDPPGRQDRDGRLLRSRRSRGRPRHARVVLLRRLGAVGKVGRRGSSRRSGVAPRSAAAAAEPSEHLRMAQRQRQAARRRRRTRVSEGRRGRRVEPAGALERGRSAGTGQRTERREDARSVRLRPAVVLARGYEPRRRGRLRDRDRPGRGGAADRKSPGDAAEGSPLADRP